MEPDIEWPRSDIFVVRVMRRSGREPAGVIHHVRTGEKRRFDDLPALGAAIAEMRDHGPRERPGAEPPEAGHARRT
jgi:hypothetical protein